MRHPRLLLLSLLLSVFPLPAYSQSPSAAVGTGMWIRFHHGPSTFALAPGASVDMLVELVPNLGVEAKLSSGALFGTATGLSVSALYTPVAGPWRPAVGLGLQGMAGSTLFYYQAGTTCLDVLFPEWSAGIVLKPFRFELGSFGVSALELMMGTDIRATIPTSLEVYGRIFDLVEIGAFGTLGTAGSQPFATYRIVTGIEERLAPAGRCYMPYAGLGLAYGFFHYETVLPDDHMLAGYVTIAPLRFDLRPLLRYDAAISPTISLLQIRYGPFYADGGLPQIFDSGNWLMAVDVVRLGVLVEL